MFPVSSVSKSSSVQGRSLAIRTDSIMDSPRPASPTSSETPSSPSNQKEQWAHAKKVEQGRRTLPTTTSAVVKRLW